MQFYCSHPSIEKKHSHIKIAYNYHGDLKIYGSQAWWCMPGIPAFQRWGQEHLQCKMGLGYNVRACLSKKKKLMVYNQVSNIYSFRKEVKSSYHLRQDSLQLYCGCIS
jgi:hypothetical protein